MLDYSQIKELIREIDGSSLRVFELENSDIKLKLSKNDEYCVNNDNAISSDIIENTLNKVNKIENISNEAITEEEIEYEDLNIIKSPLVGTYYSSGSPGADAYVGVGALVKKGDVLCIVEAMKIMNEITSEVDGEIVEILRSDEDIVEFGMELFKIRSK